MHYTVLGSSGFIGKHVAEALRCRGYAPFCPGREEDTSRRDLGTVFYCIGLTADFRQRPLETVDAHVCMLNSLLCRATFE